MKLYGFWRSLATYRVKVALALKNIAVEEVSIDLLKGADARGRARVRGLALIAAADGHPLVVPRIRNFLEKEMKLDEGARNRWLAHWTLKALEAMEGHLKSEKETGRFCHGDTPTLADICLAGQVVGAVGYFKCDVSGVPTAMRIYEECMKLDAFSKPHPMKQPGAAVH